MKNTLNILVMIHWLNLVCEILKIYHFLHYLVLLWSSYGLANMVMRKEENLQVLLRFKTVIALVNFEVNNHVVLYGKRKQLPWWLGATNQCLSLIFCFLFSKIKNIIVKCAVSRFEGHLYKKRSNQKVIDSYRIQVIEGDHTTTQYTSLKLVRNQTKLS